MGVLSTEQIVRSEIIFQLPARDKPAAPQRGLSGDPGLRQPREMYPDQISEGRSGSTGGIVGSAGTSQHTSFHNERPEAARSQVRGAAATTQGAAGATHPFSLGLSLPLLKRAGDGGSHGSGPSSPF